MEIKRYNARSLTAEEIQKIQEFKLILQRAIADGVITQAEISNIENLIFSVKEDQELTYEELELVEELVYSKVREGKIIIDAEIG